jgi:hypothetical protein
MQYARRLVVSIALRLGLLSIAATPPIPVAVSQPRGRRIGDGGAGYG